MAMTRGITTGLAALMAAVTLQACGGSEAPARPEVRIDPATAAVVNGEPIYIIDVELEALAQGLIERGENFEPTHPEFARVLDQLIDQTLMAQEAEARGLDQDEQARHRLEIARERILGNLLLESLVASEVTQGAIRDMYEEQVALQQLGDEVRLAQIVTETEAEANEVKAKLDAGEAFATLAFQYSTDLRTRAEGGELGWVAVDRLDPELVGEVGNTPVGNVSDPFETESGWVILKLNDRRQEAPKTFEEMRPDIVKFMTLTQISKILRDLRAEGQIEVMDLPDAVAADEDDAE
jgi:peptidyl-prolyl cis-trans isomerase C